MGGTLDIIHPPSEIVKRFFELFYAFKYIGLWGLSGPPEAYLQKKVSRSGVPLRWNYPIKAGHPQGASLHGFMPV